MPPVTTVLQRDTEFLLPANIIVSASAGSGKTYTLTQRYVQFLLSDRIPNNSLRNILAITFTNLAAKEMRQKVLRYLKALALGRKREVEEMAWLLSLDVRSLQTKAARLVENIISHYSDFQVKTIDSFMVSVFKATALDFGFTPDVEILLTNDTLIEEAFESYSLELNRHPGRRELLEELIELLSQTREGSRRFLWDPYSYIVGEVKELYEMLSSHPKPPLQEDLREELRLLKDQIKEEAQQLDALLKDNGIQSNRYLQNDLDDIRSGDVDAVAGRGIKDKAIGKLNFASQRAYKRHQPEIESRFSDYNTLIARYRICTALMHFQPYLRAVAEIREVLDSIKRQRGQLFIHDVNKKLVDVMRIEQIPDIYFRLGETIFHHLIDEFQDTSPIQWANLKPLIENSLAQPGSSLFTVGDMKQSIYGFRFADWTIMKRMIDRNEFPSAHRSIVPLNMNWRSHERILDFNREVFQRIIPSTEYATAAHESGLDASGQIVRGEFKGKGYVEVDVFQQDVDAIPEKKKLLDVIADCRSRGHRLRDISVLTPRNEDVIAVSAWLNEKGIRFVSHSSLDIRTRKITGEIISLLQFLDSPVDDLSFAAFILSDLFHATLKKHDFRVTREDLHGLILDAYRDRRSPLYKVFQEQWGDLWDRYFADLYATVGYLPLYDLVSDLYKVFSVFEVSSENEGTLAKLLEVVKLFEERGNNSMKEFLGFALDEGDVSGWEMDAPTKSDAVTLMTVHKAKGLDFRVVVVLLYDVGKKPREYYVDESENGIRLLHIAKKSYEKVEYLEAIHDRERLKDDVDELNKLYVALTRAKEEMYVLGVYDEERKLPTRFLPDQMFPAGKKPVVSAKPEETKQTVSVYHHDVRRKYEVIAGGRLGILETKRGEAIHAILSRIEFLPDDVGKQINDILRELDRQLHGRFSFAELGDVVKTFLAEPTVREFFRTKDGRTVYRESDFVNSSGLLFRMDRVIVERDSVTVIDFKTGGDEEEENYRAQVKNYIALLREVYPTRTVKGLIAYIDKRQARFVE